MNYFIHIFIILLRVIRYDSQSSVGPIGIDIIMQGILGHIKDLSQSHISNDSTYS